MHSAIASHLSSVERLSEPDALSPLGMERAAGLEETAQHFDLRLEDGDHATPPTGDFSGLVLVDVGRGTWRLRARTRLAHIHPVSVVTAEHVKYWSQPSDAS